MQLQSSGASHESAITIAAKGNEQWNVEVYNAAGKLCSCFMLSNAVCELSTAGWSEGLYFIAFKSGQYVGLQKMLVH